MEMNLVDLWLKKNPARWLAGAMAGVFASAVMVLFAGFLARSAGRELSFPLKVMALPIFGGGATAFDAPIGVMAVGAALIALIGAVLGAFYAHFTGSNKRSTLLGMGVVWGIFGWIFISNLFLQSFADIRAAQLAPGAMFFVCLVFGVSLASVAWFDRGSSAH